MDRRAPYQNLLDLATRRLKGEWTVRMAVLSDAPGPKPRHATPQNEGATNTVKLLVTNEP